MLRRHLSRRKPELDDYVAYNLLARNGRSAGEPAGEGPAHPGSVDPTDGDSEGDDWSTSGHESPADVEKAWRASLSRERPTGGGADDGGLEDESGLYPRTVGSSASVLDEKEAVRRSRGEGMAAGDPVRARLAASDPFVWIGRLHSQAAAIAGLVDQADAAIAGLEVAGDGSVAAVDESRCLEPDGEEEGITRDRGRDDTCGGLGGNVVIGSVIEEDGDDGEGVEGVEGEESNGLGAGGGEASDQGRRDVGTSFCYRRSLPPPREER